MYNWFAERLLHALPFFSDRAASSEGSSQSGKFQTSSTRGRIQTAEEPTTPQYMGLWLLTNMEAVEASPTTTPQCTGLRFLTTPPHPLFVTKVKFGLTKHF